jgi:hypothetical protein
MSEEPRLRKYLRPALVGSGAMMVMSAIVGIVSAYMLIAPEDAEFTGIKPGDFVGFYVAMAVIGGAMIFFGLRKKKPRRQ